MGLCIILLAISLVLSKLLYLSGPSFLHLGNECTLFSIFVSAVIPNEWSRVHAKNMAQNKAS